MGSGRKLLVAWLLREGYIMHRVGCSNPLRTRHGWDHQAEHQGKHQDLCNGPNQKRSVEGEGDQAPMVNETRVLTRRSL